MTSSPETTGWRPLLWMRWALFERGAWTWEAYRLAEDARRRAARLAKQYAREGYRYPTLKAMMEVRRGKQS